MNFIYDPSLVLYLPLYELEGASFGSKDAYGHTCTVTNATSVGIWGFDFDGTDDKIDCGSAAVLDDLFDGGGSVLAWVNIDTDGENDVGRIFDKAVYLATTGESSSKVKLTFYIITDGDDGQWDTTATAVTCNQWDFIAVTYNAGATTNDPIIYVNGMVPALTESSTPSDARTTDAASSFLVGDCAAGDKCLDGTVGEMAVYSRILSAPEVMNYYEKTRWRYQ